MATVLESLGSMIGWTKYAEECDPWYFSEELAAAIEAYDHLKGLQVEVRPRPYNRTLGQYYGVWIVNKHQSFQLDYSASKEECEWYANQLRIAMGLK